MDRFLLRDSQDMDFIKSIDNTSILTTRDLKEAYHKMLEESEDNQ